MRVVSAYPGTPSTEITESAVKYPEIYCEWAPNEKVVTETACGASTVSYTHLDVYKRQPQGWRRSG